MTDFLQHLDTVATDYQENFDAFIRESSNLRFFGGHLSIRSMRARAEATWDQLALSLETPEISRLPSAANVTSKVSAIWQISCDLYEPLLELEYQGQYLEEFDAIVRPVDGPWNKKRSKLPPLIERALRAHRRLLNEIRQSGRPQGKLSTGS